ncbi:hypothetical protein [Kitasatospora sp. GAS204B]|nr:hypothetical protein [Kitasatospora sp. GAS204B]MDH6119078.1 preprotein translocase subunit SecE [Kitasatospora sp. GAS204B]
MTRIDPAHRLAHRWPAVLVVLLAVAVLVLLIVLLDTFPIASS